MRQLCVKRLVRRCRSGFFRVRGVDSKTYSFPVIEVDRGQTEQANRPRLPSIAPSGKWSVCGNVLMASPTHFVVILIWHNINDHLDPTAVRGLRLGMPSKEFTWTASFLYREHCH